MRILAVGGGSGGHVTPIVAVLSELQEQGSGAELRVWCDAKFYAHTKDAVGVLGETIRVQRVVSGKLRRFYDVPLWRQLLRFRTLVAPNIVDGFKVAIGVVQSTVRMIIWRPDVVFCKGGFVSLPVGMAARLLRIPVVLHDSDAHPGLANRLLARWAKSIGTGSSPDSYPYAPNKTRQVGIPIKKEFHKYSDEERVVMKKQLGVSTDKPLVVATGGGLGAKPINDVIVSVLDALLSQANVLLISGDTQYGELQKTLASYTDASQFQLHAFLGDMMLPALAASDVVVARAGATTLLELAALGTPTILVPNPNLPGGHQTKNAQPYAQAQAAVVLSESELEKDPSELERSIVDLLDNESTRRQMSIAMQKFAMPHAAKNMASMVLEAADKKEHK